MQLMYRDPTGLTTIRRRQNLHRARLNCILIRCLKAFRMRPCFRMICTASVSSASEHLRNSPCLHDECNCNIACFVLIMNNEFARDGNFGIHAHEKRFGHLFTDFCCKAEVWTSLKQYTSPGARYSVKHAVDAVHELAMQKCQGVEVGKVMMAQRMLQHSMYVSWVSRLLHGCRVQAVNLISGLPRDFLKSLRLCHG